VRRAGENIVWAYTPLYLLSLVLFFVVLLGGGILLSVPIGFAFGLATIGYLGVLTDMPLSVVVMP